jgi:hypothetical protein
MTPFSCPDCTQSPTAHAAAEWNRRTFLRRALGSVLGLTVGGPLVQLVGDGRLTGLSAVQAAAAAGEWPVPNDPPAKAVILLWMNGGPSQLDTFDPKPAHANGAGVKAIRTAARGIRISEFLPQTASVLDRVAVVRCMSTGEGTHARARELMHTGFTPNPTVAYPGLGSIVTFERGELDTELPQNIAINAPGQRAGLLGLEFDPLVVEARDRNAVPNLQAPRGLTDERIDRRLRLLREQEARFTERLGGECPEAAAHGLIMENAVRFMRSDQTVAFDLTDEPQAVREAYGDTRFGRGCLMARRLVERGARFVEVTLNGWDTHDDNTGRVRRLCGELDPAYAALLRDLAERDLLDSTLVIWMGEFGRTPRVNAREGRDHFARAWSVALAGAGVRGGTVIGETSADGSEVVGNSVATADLFRTVLWLCGIDPDYRYYSPKGRPVTYADGGRLITGMLRPQA